MAEFFFFNWDCVNIFSKPMTQKINAKVTHFYNYNLMIEKHIFKIVTNSVCKHTKIMLNQVSFWLFTALVNHLFQIWGFLKANWSWFSSSHVFSAQRVPSTVSGMEFTLFSVERAKWIRAAARGPGKTCLLWISCYRTQSSLATKQWVLIS